MEKHLEKSFSLAVLGLYLHYLKLQLTNLRTNKLILGVGLKGFINFKWIPFNIIICWTGYIVCGLD